MKPNFEKMSTKELTTYLRSHRDDLDALEVLVNRRTPDEKATWYPAVTTADGTPIEENIRIMEEAIQKRIEQNRQSG